MDGRVHVRYANGCSNVEGRASVFRDETVLVGRKLESDISAWHERKAENRRFARGRRRWNLFLRDRPRLGCVLWIMMSRRIFLKFCVVGLCGLFAASIDGFLSDPFP